MLDTALFWLLNHEVLFHQYFLGSVFLLIISLAQKQCCSYVTVLLFLLCVMKSTDSSSLLCRMM